MKTYIFEGKQYKARSKDEVLRKFKLHPTQKNRGKVTKISRCKRYTPR
jgi:hypothetical protein